MITTPMPMPVTQRLVLAYVLAWHWTNTHQENPQNNNEQPNVLVPICQTLTENKKRCERLDHRGYAVPHAVHVQDVRLFETHDGEIDDSDVSSDTSEKVAQLVASCKELQMKVTEYFGERKYE